MWWNSSWAISNPERWCCESAALNMPANLENSAMATVLEKVSLHLNPKERQCQGMFKLHSTALISHASKVMLKILHTRLWQYVNRELPDVQTGFRKGRGARDQIANIHWIIEKVREFQKKTSTSASLTRPKPLNFWITINWKFLQGMGIPDHLTWLLRNLHIGQEATVRTRHGTMDWFPIRKGICQGWILPPCLLPYMQNTSC